jgi:hypothetical protein
VVHDLDLVVGLLLLVALPGAHGPDDQRDEEERAWRQRQQ